MIHRTWFSWWIFKKKKSNAWKLFKPKQILKNFWFIICTHRAFFFKSNQFNSIILIDSQHLYQILWHLSIWFWFEPHKLLIFLGNKLSSIEFFNEIKCLHWINTKDFRYLFWTQPKRFSLCQVDLLNAKKKWSKTKTCELE